MAWLLAQPGVATVIPGAKTREQLADNVGAMNVQLAPSDIDALRALSQPLYDHLGDDPDMWDENRYR
jgi:aryl-alcohol dehydrogenase-like predicted oxidoreductase